MELVKIEERIIGNDKIQVVNARELHERLEVGRDFSHWIKERLEESQSIVNVDFIVFAKIGDNLFGGRPSMEYAISLDSAKHIAMLERSKIGREVRQYFIDIEKRAKLELEKAIRQSSQPPSPREMAIRDFKVYKELGELVQLPPSTIVSEAAKMVDRAYGTNFVEFVKPSPLLDHVKKEDEFLEPTELGQRFSLSAIAMNKKLASLGLQYKDRTGWKPTTMGEKLCFVHQWTTGSKSGYNVKWNVTEIAKLFEETENV